MEEDRLGRPGRRDQPDRHDRSRRSDSSGRPHRPDQPGGDDRRALGAAGEALAAEHLAQRGYRILARNVRAGGVEVDLVAARGRTLVFAEVKARRSRGFGLAEEAVDARKRARLVRAARAWLREHPAPRASVRFDVIAVEWAGSRATLRHLEGAFDAGDG